MYFISRGTKRLNWLSTNAPSWERINWVKNFQLVSFPDRGSTIHFTSLITTVFFVLHLHVWTSFKTNTKLTYTQLYALRYASRISRSHMLPLTDYKVAHKISCFNFVYTKYEIRNTERRCCLFTAWRSPMNAIRTDKHAFFSEITST